MRKTHLIDKVPWWGAMLIAIGYVLAFFICVGVGGGGPGPLNRMMPAPTADSNLFCAAPDSCTVTYNMDITGMTGYHQVLYVYAGMNRPTDTVLNQPMAINQAVSWQQEFWLEATAESDAGEKVVLATNLTHAAAFTCPAKSDSCFGAFVFGQTFLWYPTYHIRTTWLQPYQAFLDAGIPASHFDASAPVMLGVVAATLNPEYSHFQLAGKYTFFTLTLCMNIVWFVFLWRGKGSTDPRNGAKLQFSSDQVWVTVLAFWLGWFDDPTFAANVIAPSFAASGFYAFCAVTFLAILLLYWLVAFDSARSASGAMTGSAAGGATDMVARRFRCGTIASAMLFWLPKLVWITITWLLVLTYYAVQRAAYLSDPAFSLFERFPFLRDYFLHFLGAWGGIYVIYLGVLLIMGFYHCRTMRPSGRYVLAVTFISIIAVLVGFFLNGLLTVNSANSSVVFMTAYGACNCYVWFLMIAYLPAMPPDAEDLQAAEMSAISPVGSPPAQFEGSSEHAARKPTETISTQTDVTWLMGAPSSLAGVSMEHVSVELESAASHHAPSEAVPTSAGDDEAAWH